MDLATKILILLDHVCKVFSWYYLRVFFFSIFLASLHFNMARPEPNGRAFAWINLLTLFYRMSLRYFAT
jgi:hypothetical protein